MNAVIKKPSSGLYLNANISMMFSGPDRTQVFIFSRTLCVSYTDNKNNTCCIYIWEWLKHFEPHVTISELTTFEEWNKNPLIVEIAGMKLVKQNTLLPTSFSAINFSIFYRQNPGLTDCTVNIIVFVIVTHFAQALALYLSTPPFHQRLLLSIFLPCNFLLWPHVHICCGSCS